MTIAKRRRRKDEKENPSKWQRTRNNNNTHTHKTKTKTKSVNGEVKPKGRGSKAWGVPWGCPLTRSEGEGEHTHSVGQQRPRSRRSLPLWLPPQIQDSGRLATSPPSPTSPSSSRVLLCRHQRTLVKATQEGGEERRAGNQGVRKRMSRETMRRDQGLSNKKKKGKKQEREREREATNKSKVINDQKTLEGKGEERRKECEGEELPSPSPSLTPSPLLHTRDGELTPWAKKVAEKTAVTTSVKTQPLYIFSTIIHRTLRTPTSIILMATTAPVMQCVELTGMP